MIRIRSITKLQRARRAGLAGLLVAGAFALAGSGGCSEPKLVPGKDCVVQSDCPSTLACSYGRCHIACREARDCAPGQTCVSGPAGNVCLLVEEAECALNSQCPVGLFCAQDLRCRSQCEESRDCATRTQLCVLPDKVCAEPADLDNGQLITPPGGSGSGGAGGQGDQPGGPGTGGAGLGGRGVGSTGTGGSAGAPGPLACDQPEGTPNETLEQATAYVVGTAVPTCIESKTDHDYYRFTVPSDPAGGYIKVATTNVGATGTTHLRLLAGSDTAPLVDKVTTTDAQATYLYAAVTPGGAYVLDASAYSFHDPFAYTLTVTYVALPDAYEPNDTRFDAKPIALGTPISAYMFSGFASAKVAPNDDYYKVTLGAGGVTVTIDVFPTNLSAQLWLYDALGAEVKTGLSITDGSGLSITATAKAGDYYVRTGTYGSYGDQAGPTIDLPDNFTRPYRLTVTQP